MAYTRIDLISFYDVALLPKASVSVLIAALAKAANNPLVDEIYRRSFNWLYDGPVFPRCRRFTFKSQKARSASLLISPELGIGTYSEWSTFYVDLDPIKIKERAWDDGLALEGLLAILKPFSEDLDRHFPFLAICVDENDLDGFCERDAETLGRIITGGYAYEERGYLRSLVTRNLSHRDYERLFLRWTDGLGVYKSHLDEAVYELTLFRAAQLFEAGIFIRRAFATFQEKASLEINVRTLAGLPWQVAQLQQFFRSFDYSYVVAPKLWSVEASELLNTAFLELDIKSLRDAAKSSLDVLDVRYQWAKAQFLAALGIATYSFDKLGIFEIIKSFLQQSRH